MRRSAARPSTQLVAAIALIIGIIAATPASPAEAATVIRVPEDYQYILQALNAAQSGDTVLVSPGEYVGSFNIFEGITVRSEAGPDVTSIELYHNHGLGVIGGTLEGFTFLLADNARVQLEAPGGVVRDNVFTATTDNQINPNHALYVYQTTAALIDGNVFHGLDCNARKTDGSAIHLIEGVATVANNLIVGTDCIGIHLDERLDNAAVTVVNNTLVGNKRGIVVEDGDANKVFHNNIVFDGADGVELQAGTPPIWTHNLVFGNNDQFLGMPDPTGVDGNVAADPDFVDSGVSPYRLSATSPAVDTGTETDAPATDLFGTSRPLDGDGDTTATTDIGAYEYGSAPGSISGTVRARSTLQGLADVCANARTESGFARGVLSGADGSFSLELPADTYTLEFSDCRLGGYGTQWWDDVADPGLASDVAVAAGTDVTGIDAALDIVASCNGLIGTIAGSAGDDTITGTTGNDVIIGFGGDDTIDGLGGDDTICGNDGADILTGGSGADIVLGGNDGDSIFGKGGADQLFGEMGDDTIDGGSGSDTIDGGVHHDTINGGNGRDTLIGGDHGDVISGGRKADTIEGGYGDDVINGGGGADDLHGGEDSDVLRGGKGNDELRGGAHDDVLKGGSGDDTLLGGSGDDTIDGGPDTDTLNGQSGVDALSFGSAPAGVVVDLGAGTVSGGSNDTFSKFENVIGSEFDDVLTGDAENNSLFGRGGDDQLFGLEGADILHGGSGADEFYDGKGDDTNFGKSGADLIVSQPGDDYMAGGAGKDTITWADAPRAITLVNHSTAKGHGRDHAEAEVLIGSDFGDTFHYNATIFGRGGDDTISANGPAGTILKGGSGDDVIEGGRNSEMIYGGSGDDSLLGDHGDDHLFGGDGDDYLFGGEDDDVLEGGAGRDTIHGWMGDDLILGGPGRDELAGDQDRDLLIGGSGNDDLDGGGGDDTLAGGRGDDNLVGNAGTDTVSYAFADGVNVNLNGGWAAGEGNDSVLSMEWIVGSEGNDTLTGDADPNLIEGRGGNDTISGLDHSDLLLGMDGDDTISGGNHNDFLYGDEGTDSLNGGSGSDECYGGESHSSCETTGADLFDRITENQKDVHVWITSLVDVAVAERLLQYMVTVS